MRFPATTIGIASVLALLGAEPAQAWEPFRSPNDNVEDGNRALASDDPDGALNAYDRAAQELPSEPGVDLNRGIALLEAGKTAEAREALRTATDPSASETVQARAHYNLGLAFYQEAEAAADDKNHAEAQRLFRESADALKRSLRAQPGNESAAWNLELAMRRIREEEKKKKQQQKQQQADNQQQDQQQQGQQGQQDQQQRQQGQQGQQQKQRQADNQQQQGQRDRQQTDDRQQGQQQQGQQQQRQQADSRRQQGQQGQQRGQRQQQKRRADDGQGRQGQERAGDDRQRQRPRARRSARSGNRLPEDVARVLDNLEESEESLQRHMAGSRGSRHRREPEKDW